MTSTARSGNGSLPPITGSSNDNAQMRFQDGWETSTDGNVVVLEPTFDPHDGDRDGSVSVSDLVTEFEAEDPEGMADARRWVAEKVYADEDLTVRALRLRLGLSQTALAERVETSQPHIARIERGTEDIQLSTFRRLAEALGVDCNQLSDALANQEAAFRNRHHG